MNFQSRDRNLFTIQGPPWTIFNYMWPTDVYWRYVPSLVYDHGTAPIRHQTIVETNDVLSQTRNHTLMIYSNAVQIMQIKIVAQGNVLE